MFERGWDLLDFFRGRRPWGQLERILNHLPRYSLYKAAVDDDEEFAELAAQLLHGGSQQSSKVPLVRYDEVVVRLDNVYDVLNAINETLIAVNSKRKSAVQHPNRAPRPETASQRLKARRRRERLDQLVQHMTGGR